VADQVTPDQKRRANQAANAILEELRGATTPEECEEIGIRTSKIFARLQQVHAPRAIHIVNMAGVKKREFAEMERANHRRNIQEQMELWK
jgi:hypothetical protein